MNDRLKAVRFDEMTDMMRHQRDEFRNPDSNLGRVHGQETREKMADLLDWFLTSYADKTRE